MAKKKKDGLGKQPEKPVPSAPERLASPFRAALSPLKKALEEKAKADLTPKPAPKPVVKPAPKKGSLAEEDEAMALSLAMQGVVPLGDDAKRARRVSQTAPVQSRTAKVAPFGPSAEADARARLEALVAQDIRFRIEREGEFVRATRVDDGPRFLKELARRTRADATLDLHGKHQREAREAVTAFVRKKHREGLDVLCVVHGKGHHSEDGFGVLRDVAIDALLNSGATPLVRAFSTAPEAMGGSGALLVLLHR